ncbi:MAG TPA: nucleoside recognition protein [Firmicutes bacterium]|nr:nucleoside recognition protein [Bacillota bacterium]
MITRQTWINGLKNGIETIWELAKVVVPVTLAVTVLKETGWLGLLAGRLEPLMSLLGLPGEAALAVVIGYFLNIYSAIAVILALDLTAQQITVLAVMLGICHNLLVEGAVTAKTGVKPLPLALLRIGVSILAGLGVNWAF